jgi:hypothetical protein
MLQPFIIHLPKIWALGKSLPRARVSPTPFFQWPGSSSRVAVRRCGGSARGSKPGSARAASAAASVRNSHPGRVALCSLSSTILAPMRKKGVFHIHVILHGCPLIQPCHTVCLTFGFQSRGCWRRNFEKKSKC